MLHKYFKNTNDMFWNMSAIIYSVVLYIVGWAGILSDGIFLNLLSTVALGHSMIIAAYLIHECAHKSLLKTAGQNEILGTVLNWITGSCYGKFEDLRYKHIRHHVDNADVLTLNMHLMLQKHIFLRKTIECLEYLHIPAIDILMHLIQIIAPWIFTKNAAQKKRTAIFIFIRTLLFFIISVYEPLALVWYCLAFILMLHVLRFMDAFQHNYRSTTGLADGTYIAEHKGDSEYEYKHTFSNLLSSQYPKLNWLVLNFCYHNAHHTKPNIPWHQLPNLHQQLYGDTCSQIIPFKDQLRCYHQNRMQRIFGDDEENDEFPKKMKDRKAVGANGVSFLTAF